MDPNTTLNILRNLCVVLSTSTDPDEREEVAAGLCEHFAALDQWLSAGGYLPGTWGLSHAPR